MTDRPKPSRRRKRSHRKAGLAGESAEAQSTRRVFTSRPALIAGTVAAAGLVWWSIVLLSDSPSRLYRKAERVFADDPAQAAQLLEQSIAAADGDSADAKLLWCRALGRQGRWLEAMGAYSLIRDPSACEPAELLAVAKEAAGANADPLVQATLVAANRPGPLQPAVLAELIQWNLQKQRDEETLPFARQLADISPNDPTPWRVMGEIYRRRRDVGKSLAAFQSCLERESSAEHKLFLFRRLAELSLDQGDVEQARRYVEPLLQQPDPTQSDRITHAYLLRLERKFVEAAREVELVLAASPGYAGALMIRGMLQLDQHRYPEAVQSLQQVVEADPRNKEAHYKLSQALFHCGRNDDAQRHLEESERLTRAAINRVSSPSGPAE